MLLTKNILFLSDVSQNGFCTSYCGWHTYGTISGVAYKYAWIGMATCSGCVPQTTSPNGDKSADAAVSVIGHELAEAVTDPTGGGYCYSGSNPSCFSSGAVENGDQCNGYYANYACLNGYCYNLVAGNMRYLVQANWNLITKTCSLS